MEWKRSANNIHPFTSTVPFREIFYILGTSFQLKLDRRWSFSLTFLFGVCCEKGKSLKRLKEGIMMPFLYGIRYIVMLWQFKCLTWLLINLQIYEESSCVIIFSLFLIDLVHECSWSLMWWCTKFYCCSKWCRWRGSGGFDQVVNLSGGTISQFCVIWSDLIFLLAELLTGFRLKRPRLQTIMLDGCQSWVVYSNTRWISFLFLFFFVLVQFYLYYPLVIFILYKPLK